MIGIRRRPQKGIIDDLKKFFCLSKSGRNSSICERLAEDLLFVEVPKNVFLCLEDLKKVKTEGYFSILFSNDRLLSIEDPKKSSLYRGPVEVFLFTEIFSADNLRKFVHHGVLPPKNGSTKIIL